MTDETEADAATGRRKALQGCVARIKAMSLEGKARDTAAIHFLAGVDAVTDLELVGECKTYLDVLEALAVA
jgi:hypothetical protein